MSNAPTKFALIGTGAIAGAYIQAFGDVEGAALVAVCDTNQAAADKAAEQAGCPAFTSLEALIAAGGFDAAIVCTPPSTHPDICHALLDAGVAVLCEKPLCITSEQAESLVDHAARSGLIFSMATKFRFVDDVAKAKALIDSGDIGRVLLFENAFTGHADMTQRWNADPAVAGGGVLIDNGTHSVDLVRHFLGPIDRVQAVEGPRVQDIPVEDNIVIMVQTQSKAIGTIDLSWSFNKELDTYVQVYGTEGTIKLGWKGAWIKRTGDNEWQSFGSGYNKFAAFADQIATFASAVRGLRKPLVSPTDALASVRVIEAAYESMQRCDWVSVEHETAV